MPFSFLTRFFSRPDSTHPIQGINKLPAEFADKQLFFLHIPKTAGSSFRQELEQHFSQNVILPNQALRKEIGGYPPFSYITELPPTQLDQFKLISGHYQYREVSAHFSDTPLLLIMMREPLSRCISECLHILRHSSHDMRSHLPPNPTISDIVRSDEVMHYLANVVSMMLLPELSEAKQLIKNSAFLGIQERMDESSKLLAHTFGWQVSPISVFNSSPQTQNTVKDEISDDIKEQFRGILSAEYELYRFACDVFESRLSEAHI